MYLYRFGNAESLLKKIVRTTHSFSVRLRTKGIYVRQKYDKMGKQEHTNLAEEDIASLVKLRVVLMQNGQAQSMLGGNFSTCIVGCDDINGQTVLVSTSKAEGLARLEVGAVCINETRVGRIKLVTTMAHPKMSNIGKSLIQSKDAP